MGSAKDRMMENEDRLTVARTIALRVGLLKKCDDHGYFIDPLNDEALEAAYKLGNSLITASDRLVEGFDGDRTALTDLIKGCRRDIGDSCPGCDARDRE